MIDEKAIARFFGARVAWAEYVDRVEGCDNDLAWEYRWANNMVERGVKRIMGAQASYDYNAAHLDAAAKMRVWFADCGADAYDIANVGNDYLKHAEEEVQKMNLNAEFLVCKGGENGRK